ncbi:hypothetical protein [Hahella sp. NBU794]|uniref:hypothetical protein n=1 Tax=Hahella sp. NBU794 TaxID=3422590 RepID=UPI003D6FFB86
MSSTEGLSLAQVQYQVIKISQAVTNATAHWEAATWEFASNYDRALIRFKSVIDNQKELEKKAVDYAFTAMSLVGGSVLTATIAKSIKGYLYDKSLSFVCNNNLEKTFNNVYTNEKVRSIVGGLYSEAERAVGQRMVSSIKDSIKRYEHMSKAPENSSFSALSGMMSYIKHRQADLDDALNNSAESYLNSIGTKFEKARFDGYNKIVSEILNCKFMYPPKRASASHEFEISDSSQGAISKIQERIELSMYIAKLLDTDSVVRCYAPDPKRKVFREEKPIHSAPSEVRYPNNIPYRGQGHNGELTMQYIKYSDYGRKVGEELNRLADKLYNRGQIIKTGWILPSAVPDRYALRKAESLANILGQPYSQSFIPSDKPVISTDSYLLNLTEYQKSVIKKNSRY